MRCFLVITVFMVCSVAHASGTASTEITRAVMLSNSCAACHGTDGKSPGAIPRINGKSSRSVYKTLMEFRDDKRPSTVMSRHAAGYTEEEIKLIADYFSSLP